MISSLLCAYDQQEELGEFQIFKNSAQEQWALLGNRVLVEMEWSGEGWNGDYDETDPDDKRLLRFDVAHFVDGQWVSLPDASYCCRVSCDDSIVEKVAALRIIWGIVAPLVETGASVKRACEDLSWLSGEEAALHIEKGSPVEGIIKEVLSQPYLVDGGKWFVNVLADCEGRIVKTKVQGKTCPDAEWRASVGCTVLVGCGH